MNVRFFICFWAFLSIGLNAFAQRPAPPREDMQILKRQMQNEVELSNKMVDQASKLSPQIINSGAVINLADCQAIEAKISANYSLHTYQDYQDLNYYPGVRVCVHPPGNVPDFFNEEWIKSNSIRYTFAQGPVKNALNVEGTGVLTVSYQTANPDTRVSVVRQYVLDSNFKILQFVVSKADQVVTFSTVISAVNMNGDVLSNVERTWVKPNSPYLWKRTAGFVSANGSVSPAFRHVQNDGKGVEVTLQSYLTPQGRWDQFELSPLLRAGGVYKIGSETTTWPQLQAHLQIFSKPGASCETGIVGYDSSREPTHLYGASDCEKKMDVETSAF